MFKHTLIAAGVLALSTSVASAVTLGVADAGNAVNFDILDPTGYDFDVDFTDGTAGTTLTFNFQNYSATNVAVVISGGSITQSLDQGFFTDGASIGWSTAGLVTSATQGQSSGNTIQFMMGAGATDSLNLTFGDVFAAVETAEPNLDFTISARAAPVPLPAGILLMGTAIAGFGVARRRKKTA